MDLSKGAFTYFSYPSAIGVLTLCCTHDAVVRVTFGMREYANGKRQASTCSNAAINEVHSYLAGRRQVFTVPVQAMGTEFQQAVWHYLTSIPYGQTRTYAEVAASIGHAKAYRAVGFACHANPVPLFVPCHRVVGSRGVLGGYAGGPQLKRALLDLERHFA